MTKRKDLNEPENWLLWLRTCQREPCLLDTRAPLGMITGTDRKVLRAVAELWHLCGYYDDDPMHQTALVAIRSLLPSMQRECWPFARELIAQALDWKDRDRLWPLVEPAAPPFIRYRFEVPCSDYRPVRFPPPGPYWRTAETLEEPTTYTLIAMLPPGEALESWWPDARNVERRPIERLTFTERFPCPEWYQPGGQRKQGEPVNIKEGRAQQWTASDGTCFTFGGDLEGVIRVGDDAEWVKVDAAPMLEFVDWLMRPADEAIGRAAAEPSAGARGDAGESVDCPDCHGTAISPGTFTGKCDTCSGTGKVLQQ